MGTSVKVASLTVAMTATIFLAACSNKGFEAISNGTSNSSSNNTNQSVPPSPATPAGPSPYDKLDMSAYIGGTSYDSQQVISLDKENNMLVLYLPLPPGPFSSLYIDVPNVKGVQIATTLDSQQKARVAIKIPLSLIVRDKVTLPPANSLPGGRSLPMMPSGEFPSLALGLNQNSDNKVYLYFGINAVGIFLESSYFPEYLGITAPVKNKAGTRTLGYFTIVPKAGANNGGLFLSFLLPKDLAKIIDDHLSGVIK
ncbi:MAG: hypothetical protein ACXVCP_08605 [Bdellovibrio sp.]